MGKTQRRASKRSQQALAKGPAVEAPRPLRQKKQRNENMDAGRDWTPVLAGNRFEGVLSDDELPETPSAPATGDSEPRSAAGKRKASQTQRRAAKRKKLAQAAAQGAGQNPPAPPAEPKAVAPAMSESPVAAQGAAQAPPAPTVEPQAPAPAKSESSVDALLARKPSAQGTVLNLSGGVVAEVLRAAPADAKVAMPGDAVKLTYQGRLAEARKGRTFDKGEVDFLLGDGGMSNGSMIRGFDVGVVGMAVSERRLLRIPWKMGYGKKGNKPKVPPYSDLIFDVVLNHAGLEWSNQAKSSMSNKRREACKRIGKKHKIK